MLFNGSMEMRLTAEPELRYTDSGKGVCNINAAHNYDAKQNEDGSWSSKTMWIKLTFWGDKLAERANDLNKGDKILVVFTKAEMNVFTREDGTPGASLVLTCSAFVKLEKVNYEEREEKSEPKATPKTEPAVDDF